MRTNTSVRRTPTGTVVRASSQVAEVIRERIQNGSYKDQTSLPSERDLAEDLNVHRRVIREAIDDLERDKLIYRRPNCRPIIGQPTVERETPPAVPASTPRLSSKFVALVMWHGGGPLERAGTSQRRIFWGINHALAQAGHHAVFLDLGGERNGAYELIGSTDQNADREAQHLRYVMEQNFGGVIFYPYAYQRNRELIQEVSRRMPMVLLDRKVKGVDVDFVGVDNHQAMFDMTNHLIEQGHRRIAYVTRCEPIHPVQDRLQGYLKAISESKVPGVQEMVVTYPLKNEDHTCPVVDAVFSLPDGQRPTAAICVSDYTAVMLSERLEQLGLSVPGDVSITGFDDIIPTLPNGIGLTSMAQPFEEIGRAAAELVERRMREPSRVPESVELPVQMILRESTVLVP